MIPCAKFNSLGVCDFTVWAPLAGKVELKILGDIEQLLPMEQMHNSLWTTRVNHVKAGDKYMYVLNGEKHRPDPASYFQPEGVHGPSEIIDHNSFKWRDGNWNGISPSDAIIYELHMGTFTDRGTFLSAIDRLDDLAALGVTVIEIMPVSQFPGKRNWGYDGVFPYAPANCYGRPDDFKTFVQACHNKNLAVILDVVYNHFGPEGNYLNEFAPYFTDKYKTPWGLAINYDEAYSDQVREYFINNVLYWLKEFHLDGLRLDAIHQIYDFSASHILRDINLEVEKLSVTDGIKKMIIAESDLNDTRIINDFSRGGYNCTAQWSDDFHHALHSLLTNEKLGYYSDYGTPEHLEKAIRNTFVYNGIYSPFRCRKHGNDAADIDPDKFVVFTQNHDQIGNRAFGERLSNLLTPEGLKLAASVLLLSPYIPLIFMGEEYGETSPFQYFVEHGDPELITSVQNGRIQEFAAFKWKGEIPDPQSEQTFLNSKLRWDFNSDADKNSIRSYYQTMLRLRKSVPALNHKSKKNMNVHLRPETHVMIINRWYGDSNVIIILNLCDEKNKFNFEGFQGKWKKIFDSENENSDPEVYTHKSDNLELGKYCVLLFEKEN